MNKRKPREKKAKIIDISKNRRDKMILSAIVIIIGFLFVTFVEGGLFLGGFLVGFGFSFIFLHLNNYNSEEIIYKVRG